ncbi:hypothetical protein QUF91_03625 [Lysinibacillus sp. G4S2]|nr:hypothetical protein [Lysinibacillus sp. G4S2]
MSNRSVVQRNGGYAKAKSNVATASSFLYESEVQRSGSVQP